MNMKNDFFMIDGTLTGLRGKAIGNMHTKLPLKTFTIMKVSDFIELIRCGNVDGVAEYNYGYHRSDVGTKFFNKRITKSNVDEWLKCYLSGEVVNSLNTSLKMTKRNPKAPLSGLSNNVKYMKSLREFLVEIKPYCDEYNVDVNFDLLNVSDDNLETALKQEVQKLPTPIVKPKKRRRRK